MPLSATAIKVGCILPSYPQLASQSKPHNHTMRFFIPAMLFALIAAVAADHHCGGHHSRCESQSDCCHSYHCIKAFENGFSGKLRGYKTCEN
ncbi:hypothetical protein PILCRDRAFT_824840 [Piloderma croceum F 1598]|uniref:Uncharacterized protein n=1 Tax=Piloderma croceum (strain F 1598) TaxID=765440 RepID=A0A0C3F037_PILCF|nr:hypothetical protein PILCRDRAFT_824840 [Piloderma croceum F 1598]